METPKIVIYRVVSNMPGYMPDSEPFATLDAERAYASMRETLERVAEEYEGDEGEEGEEAERALAALQAHETDKGPRVPFYAKVGAYVYQVYADEPIDAAEAKRAAEAIARDCDIN